MNRLDREEFWTGNIEVEWVNGLFFFWDREGQGGSAEPHRVLWSRCPSRTCWPQHKSCSQLEENVKTSWSHADCFLVLGNKLQTDIPNIPLPGLVSGSTGSFLFWTSVKYFNWQSEVSFFEINLLESGGWSQIHGCCWTTSFPPPFFWVVWTVWFRGSDPGLRIPAPWLPDGSRCFTLWWCCSSALLPVGTGVFCAQRFDTGFCFCSSSNYARNFLTQLSLLIPRNSMWTCSFFMFRTLFNWF